MSAQPRLAVIGGMGTLASAEFVRTIYEHTAEVAEQEAPPVLLWSDPSFPDRTSALLTGRSDLLVPPLQHAVEQCRALGAEEIVICCVTIHAVLPALPYDLRSRIVSLVDELLEAAIAQRRRLLLLASTGTRRTGVIERHPLWSEASRWLCWPDDEDQGRVHEAIYAIKRNTGMAQAIELTQALLEKYAADAFAVGCTEFHMLHKRWGDPPAGCVDPLDIIARRLAAAPAKTSSPAGAR